MNGSNGETQKGLSTDFTSIQVSETTFEDSKLRFCDLLHWLNGDYDLLDKQFRPLAFLPQASFRKQHMILTSVRVFHTSGPELVRILF